MTSLCTLALALSVSVAAPQNPGAKLDPDLQELSTYTLTMETLNKVDRAHRAMLAEMSKDPKFQEQQKVKAELKALRAKDETTEADDKRIEELEARLETLEAESNPVNANNAKTISDLAREIQKEPRMVAALQREGLTPREYSKFLLAMFQASFAAGMQKSGLLKTTPDGTNPANIKWILDHEAELTTMQKAWAMETRK